LSGVTEGHKTSFSWAREWFTDHRVLIVGGSSGIGAGIARGFQAAGAEVFVTGVSVEEVEKIAFEPQLSEVTAFALDVRDADAVEAKIGALGNLDCLINCAGIIRRGEELDPAVFAQVVDINLTGAMRCCAAARPALANSPSAAILNTASMLSFFGGGLVPGYAASKGGISQLTKSLAIAYASDSIRVNAVAPGWIETPLTQGLRDDPERSSAILDRTPMGRWGQPQDIASAALFLCSPAAAFITGAIINVDGGYSAM
jgi:NAD(P)-dependent dehydrogenase (short-subunit alcohol dehydrogenase family)